MNCQYTGLFRQPLAIRTNGSYSIISDSDSRWSSRNARATDRLDRPGRVIATRRRGRRRARARARVVVSIASRRTASDDGGAAARDDGVDVARREARMGGRTTDRGRRGRRVRAGGDVRRGEREGGSAVASFDRRGPDGEVMELSETNFDETVGRGAPVLVKVYAASWCKHCVALAPTWEEVARELEEESFTSEAWRDRRIEYS